jgi:hypothetical protein
VKIGGKGDHTRRAMIDIKMGDALEKFFFSVGNQKKIFYNFNTGPPYDPL